MSESSRNLRHILQKSGERQNVCPVQISVAGKNPKRGKVEKFFQPEEVYVSKKTCNFVVVFMLSRAFTFNVQPAGK